MRNYDLYVVFVERSLELLNAQGQLAFILPHKFFNAQYGEPLRGLLADGKHLRHVIHFGDQQIFPGATNYVCLLFLAKSEVEVCLWARADNLPRWLASHQSIERRIPSEQISAADWNYAVGKNARYFEKLKAYPTKLGNVADIFVGLQTSADRIYILKSAGESKSGLMPLQDYQGVSWQIEQEMLKPFLHDYSLSSYGTPISGHYLLFPYRLVNGKFELIQASDMKKNYPLAWKYFTANRDALCARESGKADGPEWHGYIYRKNLTLFDAPKLIVQVLSQSGRYSLDAKGIYFTGGGNGPYYGVRWTKSNGPKSLSILQALLNSRVHDFYIRNVSTTFKGGYWSYGKQYIEQLPIPEISGLECQIIETLVDHLLWLYRQPSVTQSDRNHPQDPLIASYFEQTVNALVYELFFPQELHAAVLNFFELAAATPIAKPMNPPASAAGLDWYREQFKKLSAPGHPLRVALDKLQTLDLVRIIEGQA